MTERRSTTTSLYQGLSIPALDEEDGGRATFAELFLAIDRPEAGVVIVPARTLRWIVRYHLDLRHVLAPVPHARSYTFARDTLAELLRHYGIALRRHPGWLARAPEYLTLIARPSRWELGQHRLAHFVRDAWGHRLAGLVRHQLRATPLASSIREQRAWLARFGEARFEEARDVLDGEGLLVRPADDGEVICELAALFYRLRFFDPLRLKALLPSLRDDATRHALDTLFRAAGVSPEALLDSSRPPGADSPAQVVSAADRREAASRERVRRFHDRDHRLARVLGVVFGDATRLPAATTAPVATLAGIATAALIEPEGRFGRLDFAGMRNAAIAHDLEVETSGLLVLDRALAAEFPEHYHRASWWQRTLLRWRSRAAVAADRTSVRRARNTRRCLEHMERELCALARPMSRWRLVLRRTEWIVGRALLAGVLERICVASEMALPAVGAAADYFRRARLRYLLDGARIGESRRAARSLVLLRQAQRIVMAVVERADSPLARVVDRRMRLEYDLRSRPFALRLSARLDLAAGEHERVRGVIDYLAHRTSLDGHGIEGELLLDLEASYLEGRRRVYAWNLADWLVSLGVRPARIELPHAPEIARLARLHRALDRAERLSLPDELATARFAPIRDLARRTADGLRNVFAPAVSGALDAVLPGPLERPRERLARETLEAALVRLMVERGHSHASDVRDVFSRNQLKLDDLAWRELVRGDVLSRFDRELARRLPGVHRSGELYLNAFQRLAAIAFGTAVGRLFCTYVLFPVALAATALTVAQLTVGKALGWLPLLEAPGLVVDATSGLVLEATVILSVVANLRLLRRAAVFALWTLPRRVIGAIGAIVKRTPRRIRTLVLYPAIGGQLTAWYLGSLWPAIEHAVGRELRVTHPHAARFALGFVLAAAAINTRVGVALAGIAAGVARVVVDAIGRGLLVRLYHLILGLSYGLVQRLERFQLAVSHALRFFEGEGRVASVAKAIAGLVWAPVYYVFRAYVLLFLEPQVNPLKFPAVSVSYKLMIPIYDRMARGISAWVAVVLPATIATWCASVFTFFFCGIFGFLAWELKENWRLYRRNAPTTVRALPIGAHGETLAQLLRPGFHAGPLPRLYRALRRATSEVPGSERVRATVRALNVERDEIHERIALFVSTELARPLACHQAFAGTRVDADPAAAVASTGHVIAFGLHVDTASLAVELTERRGVLVASVRGPVAQLDRAQQHVLALQFAYFCELAQVDASRNAVELLLAADPHPAGSALRLYDIEPGRLVVHADDSRPRTLRGRLGALWPSRGTRTIRLPVPYWLREHELEWSTYDALHTVGADPVPLGAKYLPLLGLVPESGLRLPLEDLVEPPSTSLAPALTPPAADSPPPVEGASGDPAPAPLDP